jgi:hypothetical protein
MVWAIPTAESSRKLRRFESDCASRARAAVNKDVKEKLKHNNNRLACNYRHTAEQSY